jgi:hypothetical protein
MGDQVLSPQCEKFLIEQSRKFLFWADGPIEAAEVLHEVERGI